MPHEVFVGVAQDVVVIGAVLREVERGVLEDGDKVGEPVHHFLAAAELRRVVKVRHVGQLVGIGQRRDDLLVDLVADVAGALERHHVFEARAGRDLDRRVGLAGVLVADVLDEEQHEDVVLVLARVHPAAQLVARRPERAVEFGLLESHVFSGSDGLGARQMSPALRGAARKLHVPQACPFSRITPPRCAINRAGCSGSQAGREER